MGVKFSLVRGEEEEGELFAVHQQGSRQGIQCEHNSRVGALYSQVFPPVLALPFFSFVSFLSRAPWR